MRIFTKILSFLLILGYFTSSLYAGTIDPNIPDQKYLEFGSKFKCVVKLCGSYEDNSLFCASGVVIDKHFILTAAHVVQKYKTCYAKIDDKKFVINEIIIHEDFGGIFGEADIALGFCEDGFDLESYPPLYENDDEVGKLAAIAGWGLTGNFNNGVYKSDQKIRAGSNRIDGTYHDLLVCSPSRFGTEDHTVLEYMICSGDSGGGFFIDGKLAGINSCVMAVDKTPKSVYGDESGHTRISKFLEWINEHKKKMD